MARRRRAPPLEKAFSSPLQSPPAPDAETVEQGGSFDC